MTLDPDFDYTLCKESSISRSTSIDNNYLLNYHHVKLDKINLSKSDPTLFPLSGYDTDEEETHDKPIYRSYTVGSKINHQQHQSITTWKFIANNNHDEFYPDLSQSSKKPPLVDKTEIRIPNQHGTINAVILSGFHVIIGTSQNNIQSYHLQNMHKSRIPSNSSSPNLSSTKFSSDLIRSLCLSPATYPQDDHKIVWAGTATGSILAYHIDSDEILVKRKSMHQQPITFILRNRRTGLWTLDQAGVLNIWPLVKQHSSLDISGTTIPLSETTPDQFNIKPDVKTAILSVSKPNILWVSSGNIFIDRFDRISYGITTINAKENVLELFFIPYYPNQLFALLATGDISCWDETTLEKKKTFKISAEQFSSVLCVGMFYLWIGFQNGMIVVYDTRPDPWIAVKIWKAHRSSVTKLVCDPLSIMENLLVVSMDSAGHIAVWDGLLANYWLENQVLKKTNEFCKFNNLKIMISSWNMDAVKPEELTPTDVEKMLEWLNGMDDPDIIMIGIQEIVNLSSTTHTARSIFSLNKKMETNQKADELLTHRYMLWYDYFSSLLETNFCEWRYKVIKTDQLVGLFSCVFVKETIEHRVKYCQSSVVKTGFRLMNKGLHGNKGGIAIRFIIDDSSICFVNCHLAAGQTKVLSRNADFEGIIYSAKFPLFSELNKSTKDDWLNEQLIFKRDADGTSILDHEACFISGDLNYRINMEREDVLSLLSANNKFGAWEALQLADQLKKQQASNPLFRLIGIKEAPILFDPTYKYDPGTDEYDRSEKKRIPAWCDRILYRAPPTLSNTYYRRHEVQASDHRPISAGFTLPIKLIDQEKFQQVKISMLADWKQQVTRHVQGNKIKYVVGYDLCDEKEAIRRLESQDWSVNQVISDLYRDKGYNYI